MSDLLTSLATFLGIYVGMGLAMIAPEELKYGEKHFRTMYYVLIFLIIMLASLDINVTLSIVLSMIVLLTIRKIRIEIVYFILPVIIFLSRSSESFSAICGLIMLIGLPIGTLYCLKFEKKEKLNIRFSKLFLKVTRNFGLFMVVSMVLSFF